MSFSFFARADSNNANNPALNLTNAPAVELTFVPDGALGDVTLETNSGGSDPDTLVEIGGVSYSFVFEFSGTMPTQNRDGAQQVPDQFEGSTVLLVTVQDYPSPGDSSRFAFMPEEDASLADMDAFGNGAIDVQNVDTTPTATPVCFVSGTRILTKEGERLVEDLKAGDVVVTASGAEADISWISSTHFSFSEMLFGRDIWPVCIPQGYLGRGVPHTDLWVSPQHRIVLRGWRTELHLGEDAVFVPAKHLVGTTSACDRRWAHGVDYFHLLLDRHDVVVSNGLESESFYPGKEALASIGSAARAELGKHWDGESDGQTAGSKTALPTINAHEACIVSPEMTDRSLAA